MSEKEVAERIEARLREQGLLPEEPPPWRYFQRGQGPMYAWTIEADEHDSCAYCEGEGYVVGEFDLEPCPKCEGDGKGKGWYFSFVYIPVGKGSRSGKAEEWRFQDSSLRRHRKRKDAKARAEKLYDKETK